MKTLLLILLAIVILMPVGIVLDIRYEFKEFNKGICKECGKKLELMRNCRDGERLYNCPNCHNLVVITYDQVDGGFEENVETDRAASTVEEDDHNYNSEH